LNCLCCDIGYKREDLPFGDVSQPSRGNPFGEGIGFDLKARQHDNMHNPVQARAVPIEDINNPAIVGEEDVVGNDGGPADELVKEDTRHDPLQESEFDDTYGTGIPAAVEPDSLEGNNIANAAKINLQCDMLLPEIIRQNETSKQAFLRLTKNTGWIPFNCRQVYIVKSTALR
jgi:hypothetical protein